jgi:hypothetical protein
LNKRFRIIDAEIGFRRTIGYRSDEKWEKIGIHIIKYTQVSRDSATAKGTEFEYR